MFKNYFKIAVRNLLKYKLHSFINISGLALGLASSIIIFLYANSELTFDTVHEKAENICQVYKERITPAGTQVARDTWFPMAKSLKEDFPGIEKAAHYFDSEEWIRIGNKKFYEDVYYANEDIFEVFSIDFIKGGKQNAFSNIHSIYLSKSAAEKYFGNNDPIGKTINIGYKRDYVVAGIIKDLPHNSTLRFDFLTSSESIEDLNEIIDNWRSSFLSTFILVTHNTAAANLENQFPGFVEKIWGKEIMESMKLKLTPLLALNNEETNSNQRAYILIAIAIGILLIASFNFMNLTTARSIERAKEIGLRKVIGATKFSIIRQFLSESLLISFLSISIGLLTVELMLPQFNSLFNMDIHINYSENLLFIAQVVGLGLITGLFSGAYPAFHLSRLKPVNSLKGENKINLSKFNIRQILIISQFAISVVLIIGTIIMWKQIEYMKNADLNFNKEQLVVVPVQVSDFENKEKAQLRLELLKNELRRNSGIISVASSSHAPGLWDNNWFTFVYPADREATERLRMRIAVVDDNYFDTYGIKFINGRNFSKLRETDKNGVILNEAALKAIGWTDIVNKEFKRGDETLILLGVVKDYNYKSLSEKVEPIFHVFRTEENSVHNFITIKFSQNNFTQTFNFVKEKFSELDSDRNFTYNFADDNFARLYRSEERIASVISYFSVLGIIIASLGLFALASLTVIRKRKEIGVRKILGASTSKLVFSFTNNFLKLTLGGIIIAVPLSYYLLNEWLSDFAYRVSMNPVWFLLGSAAAVFISIITVLFQAVKAANTNPVNSLRNE